MDLLIFKDLRKSDDMDIIEFAKRVCPNQELNKFQKEILLKYQKAKEENKELILCFSRCIGRTMVMKIIDEFHNHN
ncbi:hypothetical protein C8E03_108178 [Lachnotalea glycerini]|uniref:Uncharacterized protein n=1 Tax=Lachnotalea glycerini TaxID=1763509 RepID=A0A318EK42_9FIRM|nr:hypothetical protein [Lachnotalea glycerini]PXV88451.1 hypothetical protein C8E03_108178 [Lachnotalea glycerini]